jgi:chromate transporter
MTSHPDVLLSLAAVFGKLSLLSFGGAASVFPELQRNIVEMHWMSIQQFSALYALCQAAPGPNVMVFTMIGWQIAGLPGLLTCAAMTYGPTTVITAFILRIWNHYKAHPLQALIRAGLAPVTAGLISASAAMMADGLALSLPLAGIIAFSALLAICTRTPAIVILLIGGAIGLVCA